ncbi:hypothetical protein EPUL_003808 [Erysiphe pulchra]|uniref:RNase H type-1 domain-containing protein n=1 Tax=Erysiphe pulchra TaxID=225359 RepID=A0A2S4PNK7_9PEZI|nr:hypothetical protein EPUL_003808 [Erysiphe pulchra]
MYGAEVWWPEETVVSWNRGEPKELKHRCGQQVLQHSKAILMGIRAILPFYKTTPAVILYWEAGIPPIGNIIAKWIPSHSGIALNEEADRLTNAGAQIVCISQPDENPSYAAVKKIFRTTREQLLDSWWQTHAPQRYKELEIQAGMPENVSKNLQYPERLYTVYSQQGQNMETLKNTMKGSIILLIHHVHMEKIKRQHTSSYAD